MDKDLYDEFGNYIGPEILEEDEEEIDEHTWLDNLEELNVEVNQKNEEPAEEDVQIEHVSPTPCSCF